MHFRRIIASDLPAVMDIYNQAIADRYCTAHREEVDPDYMQHWFRSHAGDSRPAFVMEHEGLILGWYSLGPYREGRQALSHVAELSYYLGREHRGRGQGGRIMEHAMKYAPSCGISVLIAILLEKNSASVALLEKHGFSCWGRMPGIARIGDEQISHLYYGRYL